MIRQGSPGLGGFVGVALLAGLGSWAAWGNDAPPAAEKAKDPTRGLWLATGRVTGPDGQPMAGVEVSAHCGSGSLFRTGVATSGDDGRYTLHFGPGIHFAGNKRGAPTQAATIHAHKAGYFEANLGRQGDCWAAETMPGDDEFDRQGRPKDRLFLPDRPLEIDFAMRPAARVAGTLTDADGKPLPGYKVALSGPELPPSSSVLDAATADAQGRFALDDIPTTYRFQFEVRKAETRPPWHDSWASAGLRFEPPGQDDLHAWFGTREIRLQHFKIRVAGPGIHGRDADPIAGNLGVLDLSAVDPSDVRKQGGTRLVARSAALTLRNTTRPDVSRSLVKESVPLAPRRPSPFRVARTRPDDAGECSISFENPDDFTPVPGRHQVIVQVSFGVSRKPVGERIIRQVAVRPEGRYRVPVRIPPDEVDDCVVSIAFVTIQPDHDAWVRTFFQEGKGTRYSGVWLTDGGLLPTIPFEAPRDR